RESAARQALRSAILDVFHTIFYRFVPPAGDEDAICEGNASIGHGSLAACALEQTADHLIFFGSVSATGPGRPLLAVIDDSTGYIGVGMQTVVFEEDPSSFCSGNPLGTLRKTLTLRNDGQGPLFVCEISHGDLGSYGDLGNGFHVNLWPSV